MILDHNEPAGDGSARNTDVERGGGGSSDVERGGGTDTGDRGNSQDNADLATDALPHPSDPAHPDREDERLDEGLKETFPASDPVSAKHIT